MKASLIPLSALRETQQCHETDGIFCLSPSASDALFLLYELRRSIAHPTRAVFSLQLPLFGLSEKGNQRRPSEKAKQITPRISIRNAGVLVRRFLVRQSELKPSSFLYLRAAAKER